MSTDICGIRTKHELDLALRNLLIKKPLEQIRVRELTEQCAIRRQSFYYHFADVYQLFDWSLQQEQMQLLKRQELCLTWQQAAEDLLDHIIKHKSYYLTLLQARGRTGLQNFFRDAVRSLLERTAAYYQLRCGVEGADVTQEALLSCWETIFLALMESWLQGDLQKEPRDIIAPLEALLHQTTLGAAVQNLPRCSGSP